MVMFFSYISSNSKQVIAIVTLAIRLWRKQIKLWRKVGIKQFLAILIK